MGEIDIKVLTEEMIEEKLRALTRSEISYIDPMKMALWSVDRAVAMADGTVSKDTIERANKKGDLKFYKAGKENAVIPSEFLLWLKRFQK